MSKKGIAEKVQQWLAQEVGLQYPVLFKDIHLSQEEKEKMSQRQILKEKELIEQLMQSKQRYSKLVLYRKWK